MPLCPSKIVCESAHRPIVLPGSYATQVALPVSFTAAPLTLASTAYLRYVVCLLPARGKCPPMGQSRCGMAATRGVLSESLC